MRGDETEKKEVTEYLFCHGCRNMFMVKKGATMKLARKFGNICQFKV